MSADVFVLRDPTTLVEMKRSSFSSEAEFQHLLATFPALLAGSRIDAQSPRRWLLVAREKSVASEQDGAARWAIDHLFLDQDGIPTLVEVKRQSDSRIRREVVGQMLDYAANGVVYWPVEELRAKFEETARKDDTTPEEALAALIGPDADPEPFWRQVQANLASGRIRMLFVADSIPPELRRVVEFLNEQMNPAEVLALELSRFEGEGLTTLVPTLYGKTQAAETHKSVAGEKRTWTEETLFARLEQRVAPEAVRAARRLADWINRNCVATFGAGKQDGSMGAGIMRRGKRLDVVTLYSDGRLMLNFGTICTPAHAAADIARDWRDSLAAIPGISLPDDVTQRWPSLRVADLTDPARATALLHTLDTLVARLRTP